jgi:hypothetical protein
MLDAFANGAAATVDAGYDAAETQIGLAVTGAGALFPTIGASGGFNLWWWNVTDYPNPFDDPKFEIVRCTLVDGDKLTITRAQEGTTASTKNTASRVYRVMAALTAKTLNTDLLTPRHTYVDLLCAGTGLYHRVTPVLRNGVVVLNIDQTGIAP